VGAGHLGRIHARLAAGLEGAELVGIADPQSEVRSAMARELGVQSVADFHELIPKMDAAIVAVPTVDHHSVGVELARCGIHLLMEKPLAASVREADELMDACRRGGALLQVGHVERYNPALREVATQLAEPKYIDAIRLSAYSFRSTDIGVVLDLMIHDLDVALWLVGAPVDRVDALGVTVLGGHEDAAQARVTFANGCVANFTASRVSYVAQRSMQVWTPTAFAAIDFATRSVTLVHPSEGILRGTCHADTFSAAEKDHLKEHLFDQLLAKELRRADPANAIAHEQRDFVDAIRTGRLPHVTGEQARDALALAELILHKIAIHCWDGTHNGRVGPRALSAPAIHRSATWNQSPPRRQAG
jgi:predicted dehydrogenase